MTGNRFSLFRLLALAAFLVAVAIFVIVAEIDRALGVLAIGIALLIAWTIEWLSWRGAEARWDRLEAGTPRRREGPRSVRRVPPAAPVDETLVAPPARPPSRATTRTSLRRREAARRAAAVVVALTRQPSRAIRGASRGGSRRSGRGRAR